MLPESLLCLLSAALAYSQTTQSLTVNNVTSFNTLSLPSTSSFSLPQSEQLLITITLCSKSSSIPQFFVSNSSNSATLDHPEDSFSEIQLLSSGLGSWFGRFANGGVLAIESSNSDGVVFDIGISDSGPIHESLSELPFFGDTTSNQALLFSPPFQKIDKIHPTFPNFTLPAANMSQPPLPPTFPNYTLILSPTSSRLANGLQTGCFLSSQNTSGTIANESLWARDNEGFRTQWLMDGLTPFTNYTAFVLQNNNTKVSGPIFFATKSASFACSLVHSLPFCPGVAYSVPLPAPPQPNVAYDSTNLPVQVTTPFLSYMANFTTVLTSFACGRDWYSPLVGCEDCQREYRRWLCAVSFTRCSEPSPANPNAFSAVPAPPSATGLSAFGQTGDARPQIVLSALRPQQTSDPQRNPALPALGSPYNMLLPCLEMCNAVDRSCPPFLQFTCPTQQYNAAASYGVGYIDGADGDQNEGLTGNSQDRWGNVWCHNI